MTARPHSRLHGWTLLGDHLRWGGGEPAAHLREHEHEPDGRGTPTQSPFDGAEDREPGPAQRAEDREPGPAQRAEDREPGPAQWAEDREPGPAQWAAAGPRASGDPDGYELAVELVLEGYRLHYATPRVLHPPDADLALLLGDRLYAEGLVLLTALGDLDAIGELAEVIAISAQAHAAGDPLLAEAAWLAAGVAVGFGASLAHRDAQSAARAGEPRATALLGAAARAATGNPAPADSQ